MKTWHWLAIAAGGYILLKDSPKLPQTTPGIVVINPPNSYLLHGFDANHNSITIAYAPPGFETIILGSTSKIVSGIQIIIHRVETI